MIVVKALAGFLHVADYCSQIAIIFSDFKTFWMNPVERRNWKGGGWRVGWGRGVMHS